MHRFAVCFFATFSVVLASTILAGPPGGQPLEPLTARRAQPKADGKAAARAAPAGEAPMFYYNGDEKVYLFDTGQGVAKVRAGVDPRTLASRPEAVRVATGTTYSD